MAGESATRVPVLISRASNAVGEKCNDKCNDDHDDHDDHDDDHDEGQVMPLGG